MKKIGLIGEDPNDTSSIENLLIKKYEGVFKCKRLYKNERGNDLENKKFSNSVKIEFDDYNPDIVIFIRDVDGIVTEEEKIKKVKNWFDKLNQVVNNRGILLHNIYELEALILADIATFNRLYKTNIKVKGNVMYQKEPKEFLIHETKKKNLRNIYSTSDCPRIFDALNFDTVVKNCSYFKDFDIEFAKILKPKKK